MNTIIQGKWPQYQIIREVGKGNAGTVYEAIDNTAAEGKDHVAIRVLSLPDETNDTDIDIEYGDPRYFWADVLKNLNQEIKSIEAIRSCPYVLPLEGYAVTEKNDGFGWNVLIREKYLKSLNTYMWEKQHFTEQEVIRLGCDILSALEQCEQNDIIHTAITPSHIFITDRGDYCLGEFGAAKYCREINGGKVPLSDESILYHSPEIALGRGYSKTADLYSLAMVLYVLLNDFSIPFLSPRETSIESRNQAIERRLKGEFIPVPGHLSVEMKKFLVRALQWKSEERFGSAREMKEALLSIKRDPYVVGPVDHDSLKEPEPIVNPFGQSDSSVEETSKKDKQKEKTKTNLLWPYVAGIILLLVGGVFLLLTAVNHNRKTGWVRDNQAVYWYDNHGNKASGWQEIDGSRYYFNPDGEAVFGWVYYNDRLYYIDSVLGEVKDGWREIEEKRYYFTEKGECARGLQDIDGKIYYFDLNTGEMITGEVVIDGKLYTFDENGVKK